MLTAGVMILAGAGLMLLLLAVIGIYVYRDAAGRKLNPVLWTVVSVTAPAFAGFIIYLLVRGKDPYLECASCGAEVEPSFAVCPACGARLKNLCLSCGFPAEEGWIVCPMCAETLGKDGGQITPPVRKKDRALWRVLLLVFLIPALLFVLLCILNLSAPPAGPVSSSLKSYDEEQTERYREVPEIWDWLQNSRQEDPQGIYVLHYQEKVREEGAAVRKKTVYLIYRPSAGYMKEIRETQEESSRSSTGRVIAFEDTFDPRWSHAYFPLTCYTYVGDSFQELKLTVDGRSVDYELQEIGFDPSLDACDPKMR